mgnify:CR=1 FL=1|jgi:integrase
MSRGHIRQRGKDSWQLKFDAGRDPLTGNRRIEYVTFRGSKRSAQRELNRLLSEVDSKGYVPQQGTTVGEYARRWLDEIAAQTVSPRTWQRYEELVEHHITPHIGRCRIQDLDGSHIDSLYARLRREGRRDGKGGLSETTVRHIHRVLALIVKSAIKARVIRVNPMEAVQATPRNTKADIQILEDSEVSKLLGYLKGRALYPIVMVALGTGLRRGEVLGLRWKDVDLDRGQLRVSQVIEQTKNSLRFKEPKTTQSRRTIRLPSSIIGILRDHRREQAAMRLKLGLGRGDNDLVFSTWDGRVRKPNAVTRAFKDDATAAGLPHLTLHGLRHTHVSKLLANGVPVNVVAQRVGHANPTVTLNIYAHVMEGADDAAAAVFDTALRKAIEE